MVSSSFQESGTPRKTILRLTIMAIKLHPTQCPTISLFNMVPHRSLDNSSCKNLNINGNQGCKMIRNLQHMVSFKRPYQMLMGFYRNSRNLERKGELFLTSSIIQYKH